MKNGDESAERCVAVGRGRCRAEGRGKVERGEKRRWERVSLSCTSLVRALSVM